MKQAFFIFTAFLLLALAFQAAAQIPRTLSYQGVLTDNAGKPRPDGSYTFTFRLYTSPTGGTAIWSESKSLPVKSGLFSTELGKQTPFGAAVKFDQQYWLGIQVGTEPELSPRMALTSVGYSFSSLRADTASVSVASLADTTWRHSGANIYRKNGNIGIGTSSPSNKLEISVDNGVASADGITIFNTNQSGYSGSLNFGLTSVAGPYLSAQITAENENNTTDDGGRIIFKTAATNASHTMTEHLRIDAYGRMRLTGTSGVEFLMTPPSNTHHRWRIAAQQDVDGGLEFGASTAPGGEVYSNKMVITQDGSMRLLGASGVQFFMTPPSNTHHRWRIAAQQDVDGALEIGASTVPGGEQYSDKMVITKDGNVVIGTTVPGARLDVAGRIKTGVLEITGGSDLAEPFEISESQPIPKGALVIIDEENPGQLKLSHQAYDKRVAGVVSGAGGINPGLTLTQEGVLEGGQNVALSGRVYALATAANGPIKPGDLLTTSEVPGHAMKATDHERAYGSVIGKAMSTLESGEGLVLVLIQPH